MEIAGAQRLSAYARALAAESGPAGRRPAADPTARTAEAKDGVRVSLSASARGPASSAALVDPASPTPQTNAATELASTAARSESTTSATRPGKDGFGAYGTNGRDPARLGARLSIRA